MQRDLNEVWDRFLNRGVEKTLEAVAKELKGFVGFFRTGIYSLVEYKQLFEYQGILVVEPMTGLMAIALQRGYEEGRQRHNPIVFQDIIVPTDGVIPLSVRAHMEGRERMEYDNTLLFTPAGYARITPERTIESSRTREAFSEMGLTHQVIVRAAELGWHQDEIWISGPRFTRAIFPNTNYDSVIELARGASERYEHAALPGVPMEQFLRLTELTKEDFPRIHPQAKGLLKPLVWAPLTYISENPKVLQRSYYSIK